MWRVLQASSQEPFAFGSHDCVHLVAACLDAMTGSNWQQRLSGYYRNQSQALRIMARAGALEALVTDALRCQPMPINLARVGDVAALRLSTGPAIGICVGPRVAVASDGVKYLPLDRAHCAWRVE